MPVISMRLGYVLGGLLLLLIALRLYLPYAAANYINATLSQSDQYDGRVGDVDLMLWRGAYRLEYVLLYKANGEVDKPLFKAEHVEFTLSWSQLMKGAAVGRVVINAPEINFVDGDTEESSQSGKNEKWLSIHDIQLEINNLVNSERLSDSRVATAKARGQTAEQGTISLNAKLNPATTAPTFDLDIQADNVGLVNFKNLLDTYAPFDLEAGTLTLAAEIAADEGRVIPVRIDNSPLRRANSRAYVNSGEAGFPQIA